MDLDKIRPLIKSNFNLFFIIGIFFLIMTLFFIFAPTKTIKEDIEVTYSEQESYNVTEPHDVTEMYTQYEKGKESHWGLSGGTVIEDCGECKCHQWISVSKYLFEGATTFCDYCICESKGFRTVTKYLEISKIRNVTKTRIEQRPTEVNWIFGFKTPYTLHLPFKL